MLSAAIGLAAIDLIGAILQRPSRLSEPRLLAESLALSLLVLLAACGAVAAVAGVVARLRPRLDAAALTAALLLGGGALYAAVAVTGRVPARPDPASLLRLAILATLAVPAAAGAYAAVRWTRARADWQGPASGLLVALPAVLLVALGLSWANVYRLGGFFSARALTINAAGVAVGLALAIACRSAAIRERSGTALAAVAIAILAAPLTPSSAAAAPDTSPPAGAPRLVLLITVDTLRADALSCYREPGAASSPHIDALADDGVLFEDAQASAPWTTPSVVSIVTGLAPEAHGVVGVRTTDVPDGLVTLGGRLGAVGYRTAALVDSGFLSMARRLYAGFDETDLFPRPAPDASLGGRVVAGLAGPELARHPGAGVLTPRAIELLRRHRDQPVFLWIHYFDPHGPFEPPRELLKGLRPAPRIGWQFRGEGSIRAGFLVATQAERDWIGTLYRQQIPAFDAHVGRLLDAVRELGLYDDALIAFTADHGEELWDHGFFGHGHSLHRELLRVPLIVKLPGSRHAGRIQARVRLVDVAPTLLDVVGVDFDPEQFSGRSLVPEWRAEPASRVALGGTCGSHTDLESASFDHWKYVRDRATGHEVVYDTALDPGERAPLGSPPEPVLAEGRRLIAEHQRESAALKGRLGLGQAGTETMAPDRLDELRALGYVQ